MNGSEIRPIRAKSTRRFTIVSLGHGGRLDFKSGDELDGFVNEYGNVYTQGEQYVGSLGMQFEEIARERKRASNGKPESN